MEAHYQLTDEEFARQFANCTLPTAMFTHEAHLRLAWIHLKQYNEEQAIENICTQILAYATYAGAPGKYHTTITVAAIKAVHHFMQQSADPDFRTFIARYPQLSTDFKSLLSTHYSFDIFKSAEAKKHYIAPDLADF